MRKISMFIPLLLIAVGCASIMPIPDEQKKELENLSAIHEVKANKSQIYDRTKLFLLDEWTRRDYAKKANSFRTMTTMDSKEIGVVSGEWGVRAFRVGIGVDVDYVYKIEIKDGKYKVSFSRVCVMIFDDYGANSRHAVGDIRQDEYIAIKDDWKSFDENLLKYVNGQSGSSF